MKNYTVKMSERLYDAFCRIAELHGVSVEQEIRNKLIDTACVGYGFRGNNWASLDELKVIEIDMNEAKAEDKNSYPSALGIWTGFKGDATK